MAEPKLAVTGKAPRCGTVRRAVRAWTYGKAGIAHSVGATGMFQSNESDDHGCWLGALTSSCDHSAE